MLRTEDRHVSWNLYFSDFDTARGSSPWQGRGYRRVQTQRFAMTPLRCLSFCSFSFENSRFSLAQDTISCRNVDMCSGFCTSSYRAFVNVVDVLSLYST